MKTQLILIITLLSSSIFAQISDDKKHYNNPINNTTYTTEGEFKTYKAGEEVESKSVENNKGTDVESIIFLNSDEDLQASTSVEDLTLIIDKCKSIFFELFGESDSSGKIMVQFTLNKKKVETQFAVRDNLDLEIMKEFEKRIIQQDFPKSKKKEIKFQIIFKVNSFND